MLLTFLLMSSIIVGHFFKEFLIEMEINKAEAEKNVMVL